MELFVFRSLSEAEEDGGHLSSSGEKNNSLKMLNEATKAVLHFDLY